MDEDIMNKWIDIILTQWENAEAPGIVHILISVAYCIHMMGNTVNQIQSFRIEVFIFLWAGQLVDVGINKPIKTHMGEKWEEWMLRRGGIVNGFTKEPLRQLVAE